MRRFLKTVLFVKFELKVNPVSREDSQDFLIEGKYSVISFLV